MEVSEVQGNDPVDAPVFAIEIDAGSEPVSLVEVLVVGGVKALRIDAEIPTTYRRFATYAVRASS